jgi:hypothetical protein
VLFLLGTSPVGAQGPLPSWLTVDTSVAIDQSRGTGASGTTGVIADAYISASIGRGVEVYARPFVQRQASGGWNKQVWLAAARYEHKGDLGLRVDAGLIPPPTGLANLTLRPQLNPVISQPASLFQGLPAVEPFSPRVTLLGAFYPYGVSATVSGSKWDARGAVIDTSPLRSRRIIGSNITPRFTNVVFGGGVTPIIGLRIGGSVTRGGWKRASELPASDRTLDATLVTIEADYSFRHSRVIGEWTRDALNTTTGRSVARGWYIQAQQVLTPRFFLAARVERIGAPAPDLRLTPVLDAFAGTEEVVGFRLTRDVTVRAGHRARRPFGQTTYANQAAASIVWAHRWF